MLPKLPLPHKGASNSPAQPFPCFAPSKRGACINHAGHLRWDVPVLRPVAAARVSASEGRGAHQEKACLEAAAEVWALKPERARGGTQRRGDRGPWGSQGLRDAQRLEVAFSSDLCHWPHFTDLETEIWVKCLCPKSK